MDTLAEGLPDEIDEHTHLALTVVAVDLDFDEVGEGLQGVLQSVTLGLVEFVIPTLASTYMTWIIKDLSLVFLPIMLERAAHSVIEILNQPRTTF